jgi:quercetin dioxygenase-like cupin family protein
MRETHPAGPRSNISPKLTPMSLGSTDRHADSRSTNRAAVYVPATDGVTTWFDSAAGTVKLRAVSTHGTLGLVEVSVQPGVGPAGHAHLECDETFYVLSGEIEVLDGDAYFRAGPGDIVHVPRGSRHGFKCVGFHPARILVLFTPGGQEGIFIEGGDEARADVPVPVWGSERWSDPDLVELFKKYRVDALP